MTMWRAVMLMLMFISATCGWYALMEGEMVNTCVMAVCVALCCAGGWRESNG